MLPRQKLLLLSAAAAICLAAALVCWQLGLIESILTWKEPVLTWFESHPLALFFAIVILPGLAFPVSPLLILAGIVWGATWQSCSLAILAMSLNMAWTYLLAAGPATGIIERILGERWDKWRGTRHSSKLRLIVFLRITPGIPFVFQNYILGVLGVPFITYLLISIPLNSLFSVGFVLTGGAIFEGNFGKALTGIAILIAAFLAIHALKTKLKKRLNKTDPLPG